MEKINFVNCENANLFYESVNSQIDLKAENLLGVSPTFNPKLESFESVIDSL